VLSGEPRPASARVSRAALAVLAALTLGAVAFVLSGCETTAEKSAKLERSAKRVDLAAQQGLSIKHESKLVKVLSATLVHGSEGTAAVLRLRNSSPHALRDVPIAISLKDAHGTVVYSNATPGLAKTLTSLALLAAAASPRRSAKGPPPRPLKPARRARSSSPKRTQQATLAERRRSKGRSATAHPRASPNSSSTPSRSAAATCSPPDGPCLPRSPPAPRRRFRSSSSARQRARDCS